MNTEEMKVEADNVAQEVAGKLAGILNTQHPQVDWPVRTMTVVIAADIIALCERVRESDAVTCDEIAKSYSGGTFNDCSSDAVPTGGEAEDAAPSDFLLRNQAENIIEGVFGYWQSSDIDVHDRNLLAETIFIALKAAHAATVPTADREAVAQIILRDWAVCILHGLVERSHRCRDYDGKDFGMSIHRIKDTVRAAARGAGDGLKKKGSDDDV